MTNYQNGSRYERKLVNEAKARGEIAFRSAGSHSPIDVITIDPILKKINLIQCKINHHSDNAIQKLIDELKHIDGTYEVKTVVKIRKK